MKGITVNEEFVKQVLAQTGYKPAEKVSESVELEVKDEDLDESEDEGHVCPLCESDLAAPLSEEQLKECAEFIVGYINENYADEDEDLEDIDEEEVSDFSDEEYDDTFLDEGAVKKANKAKKNNLKANGKTNMSGTKKSYDYDIESAAHYRRLANRPSQATSHEKETAKDMLHRAKKSREKNPSNLP